MYDKMIRGHGYSIRKLAEKLGKDKGYLENRLRLADAPIEIRQLVSLRKDTLSHAYELMKVQDPRKRQKLAEQVSRGELTLVKLREKIDGRPARIRAVSDHVPATVTSIAPQAAGEEAWTGRAAESRGPVGDDSLIAVKQQLADAVDEFLALIRNPDVLGSIGQTDRSNLAKYLTIAKIRLENAITVIRSGDSER